MELGAFSVSLAVTDISKSKTFYETLGFSEFAGDITQNWLIMKNGDAIVGLFQDMFEKNILTFNPGWDTNAAEIPSFTDVRQIRRELESAGVTITDETGEDASGPASFTVIDPDGNPILIDQHR